MKFPLFHMYRVPLPPPELARQFLVVFIKWANSEKKYIYRFSSVYKFTARYTTSVSISPQISYKQNDKLDINVRVNLIIVNLIFTSINFENCFQSLNSLYLSLLDETFTCVCAVKIEQLISLARK